jgi:hypothetical protein
MARGRTGGWLPMDRLSLRSNRLKLETSREAPVIREESIYGIIYLK